jgi:antitoxin component YwqK of YwqJK toxin-antitoxin module
MTLKWCAFTGALMLAFVFATLIHKGVTADPPGVETRWWDGTVASKEVRYPNGKLAMRVEFGDDGTTVISLKEWNEHGALIHSKQRSIEDGTVEEKQFTYDGKILVLHKLWNGDELTFRAERTFWPNNGKISTETINTEDGLVPAEVRQYDREGNLQMERKILDNADAVTTMYSSGKVTSRSIFKANGDSWEEMVWGDGSLKYRSKTTRLDGEQESEGFTPSGKLLFKATGNLQTKVREVYEPESGKLRLRQYYKGWGMVKVEEYSLDTGRVTRAYVIDDDRGIVSAVQQFRADGTLELVKQLDVGDKVVKTTTYDAAGKTIVSEQAGGTPENLDRDIFLDEVGLLNLFKEGRKQ